MKIVRIFAEKLFSFHYDGEPQDEYGRLLEIWNDPEYVYQFAEQNNTKIQQLGYSIDEFVTWVLEDAEVLEESLRTAVEQNSIIDRCFQPLYNQETRCRQLSLQKKRCHFLRLYAIRIDRDCFVITGGAIKITRTMQEHPETERELRKLNTCKNYLQSEGVFDNDSFFEIIGD